MANEILNVGQDPFSVMGGWLADTFSGTQSGMEEQRKRERVLRERLRANGPPTAMPAPAPAPAPAAQTPWWTIDERGNSTRPAPAAVPAASAVDNGFRVGANEGPSVKAAVAAPGSMGANVGARDREIAALERELASGKLSPADAANARTVLEMYRQQAASGQAKEDAPGWKDQGASQPVERGGQPNPAARAGAPGFAGGPGTGATATVNGGRVLPRAIDWQARADDLAEQYRKANAPPDLQGLADEGKRRGTSGMNNLMLALAAQNAGKENDPVAGAFLKRAMAMQDPLKFSGGQVDEAGNVVIDPGYKREQLLAHLDRLSKMNTEGQLNEQRMANEQLLARIAANGKVDAAAAGGASRNKLPQAAVNKIAEFDNEIETLGTLGQSYKPEYGPSMPLTGGVENFFGNAVGTDAANWHSQYAQHANVVRNRLFGSALTATEKSEWEKAMITPNTPAEEVPRRLRQQAAAVARAREKLLNANAQGGYDVSEFPRTGAGAGAPAGGAPAGGGGGGADPLGIRR